MLPSLLLVAAPVVLAPAALKQSAPICDPGAQAVREVREVARGIVAADNARDLQRVLDYYAVDAILMPPGEAPLTGREAIRPRYEALFSSFNPEIEMQVEEACAGNGLAFVRGRNGGRLVARQGGPDRKLDDAYLMILKPDAGGRWRISHLMWHPASSAIRQASE